MRWLRPHPVVWLDRTLRLWWPFLASIAAICVVATMSFVTWTVVDERQYFEEEQARDRRQDQALADLLEAQQAEDEAAAVQVAETLRQAEELLGQRFAQHDLNVALKLNEMLRRIEALLGRPAGLPLDPVTALPYGSTAPDPASSAAAPSPAPRSAPPTTAAPSPTQAPRTTTTTTPDQRACAKRPSGPRC